MGLCFVQGTDRREVLLKALRLEEVSWGVDVIRKEDCTLRQVTFRDLAEAE